MRSNHLRRREFITLLGGAAALPLAGHAQQSAMPVIGYLSTGSAKSDVLRVTAIWQGLNQTGFVDGQNVTIEYRWAEGQNDRLPALATNLVNRQVAVIVAVGTQPTVAAKMATSTIPILFNLGVDPVQAGLVASLHRPGGNLTGVSLLNVATMAKRLDLLHELVPTAVVSAVLVNPPSPLAEAETKEAQQAARSLGLRLHVLNASTESEIDTAFATLVKERAGTILVSSDTFFTNHRVQLVELAARHAIPAMYTYREYPIVGGLMSYGTSLADAYRQVGVYAGRILKGTKPADLPVQQVVRVELVINQKTAKALGLTFPITLLGRADEVIE